MLNMNNSTFNFSGTTEVNGQTIASFAAGYSGSDVFFSISITDIDKYINEENTFNSDFDEFKDNVIELVTRVHNSNNNNNEQE